MAQQGENPFAAPASANPFAAPAPQPNNAPVQAMNPFDPLSPPPADPFASTPQPGATTVPKPQPHAPGVVANAPVESQQPFVHQPPQQNYSGQPQPQPQPQPQLQVSGQAQGQKPLTGAADALVPTRQQPATGPYGGLVSPPLQHQQPQQQQISTDPFQAQALVPAAQQGSQWASAAPAPSQGTAGSFDPFAPPPPPTAPAPAPPPQQITAMVPAAPSQQYPDAMPQQVPVSDEQMVPFQQPAQTSAPPPPVNEVNAVSGSGQSVISEPDMSVRQYSQGPSEMVQYSEANRGDMVPYSEATSPSVQQNKYSQILAREAPPGVAPLPKGEMVSKSGYILSRISFRTILMKKWKQTFWVQYGRHTMLWFRSENDFSEWLNNPYLTQSQRNFLIKLAVNFVHDLYKPNVRGYQVTQARTKAYGKKMLRQFKLERWMDYGPTIAAAFASPDPQEVDTLREAIIECMKNTPLEGGIHATGAVRQSRPDGAYEHDDYSGSGHYENSGGQQPYQNYQLDGNGRNYADRQFDDSYHQQNADATAAEASVASTPDLLGGFEDTTSFGGGSAGASQPPPQPYAQQQPPMQSYAQQPPAQPYHQPQQPPAQAYAQQQPYPPQAHQPPPQPYAPSDQQPYYQQPQQFVQQYP